MSDILAAIRHAQKLLADVPLCPFFASSKLLPADSALSFIHEGRKHVGAHPLFWKQVPIGSGRKNPWSEIPIVDLDHDREKKIAFFGAMREAMEPSA